MLKVLGQELIILDGDAGTHVRGQAKYVVLARHLVLGELVCEGRRELGSAKGDVIFFSLAMTGKCNVFILSGKDNIKHIIIPAI